MQCHCKSTLCTVSKDKLDTNGLFHEACIVYTVACQKAAVRLKHRQIVKKIKPIALAIVKIRWYEGISQAFSQSTENTIKQLKIP